jgi:adenine phosphoribosyltransferase
MNDLQEIARLMPKMKKHNVDFISISPLLACPKYSAKAWEILKQEAIKLKPKVIAGIDSRGYLIGSILANALGIKFAMIAKAGKLPGDVIRSEAYKTEYNSQDSMEMVGGIVNEKDTIVIVDDILASGGSALNASNLIILAKAKLVGFLFLGEIVALSGKAKIQERFPGVHVFSVVSFSSEDTRERNILDKVADAILLQAPGLPRNYFPNATISTGLPIHYFADMLNKEEAKESCQRLLCDDNGPPHYLKDSRLNHTVKEFPENVDIPIHTLDLDQELYRIIIMYHPSRKQHAEEIFLRFPNYFQLQEISWGVFPDGWSNIKLLNPEKLVNRHVVFLFAMDDISIVLEQLFVCMILPAQFLKSLIIDVNYFAPGTHERVTSPGVLASAEPMARMFSVIPHTRSGPVIIQLTDLHALPNQFYFQKCFTSFISSIPMLLECKPKSTIVFPDDGAYKRFGPMILAKNPICPMLICSKMRDGENRSVTISEYKNFPAHYLQCPQLLQQVIIVDDLCHSGNTLVECAKALKKIDLIQFIDVWVTHGVFENCNYEAFLKTGKHASLFRDIHITNSILSTANKVDFKIHSMSETIGENLLHLAQFPLRHSFPVYYCDHTLAIHNIFGNSKYWSMELCENFNGWLSENRLEIIILSEDQGWSITTKWFMNSQIFRSRHEVVLNDVVIDDEKIKNKLLAMIFH